MADGAPFSKLDTRPGLKHHFLHSDASIGNFVTETQSFNGFVRDVITALLRHSGQRQSLYCARKLARASGLSFTSSHQQGPQGA